MTELLDILRETATITVFVFAMLLLVDFLEVLTGGRIKNLVKGRPFAQYGSASLIGSVPGCVGGFLNVSFYMRGLLTIGALTAAMIAEKGDEAFVMLQLFPEKALVLFGILFVLGIAFAPLADYVARVFKISPSGECETKHSHAHSCEGCYDFKNLRIFTLPRISFIFTSIVFIALLYFNIFEVDSTGVKIFMMVVLFFVFIMALTVSDHYLKEHIVNHIMKQHMWRIFLWTLFALLFVKFGMSFFNLKEIVKSNPGVILFLSAIIGLIPESGPHLIFVILFAGGFVPFSVLFTSSFVQDGHAMLPLLAYSVRDSVFIKIFKFIIGLTIGFILFKAGF
ncbi:MAG: putative manganese transporter [Armatimonadota bacterium]